ncbi:hypothetical protein FCV25MIE_09252 [Fagus crenata]
MADAVAATITTTTTAPPLEKLVKAKLKCWGDKQSYGGDCWWWCGFGWGYEDNGFIKLQRNLVVGFAMIWVGVWWVLL